MNESNYKDIIDLPHHVSHKRPHMTLYNRAAQFSPFAALTGHSAAIAETARTTEKERDVDNAVKEEISDKLNILSLPENENSDVVLRFFVDDSRKDGGGYETVTGRIRRIDENKKEITISDGRKIQISRIYSLEGKIFEDYGY